MKKLALPLTLLAAATLAACGSPQVRSTEPVVYVTPVPGATIRAGSGKIVELLDPTGPIDGISWQRMTLKMADGSMQFADRRGHQVALGEQVQVR